MVNLNNIIRAAKNTELIITPDLNEWLMAHGDEAVPPDVAKRIYDLLTTAPRERSASFSASSSGHCHRKQVLQYLGVPEGGAIDPQLQNIFNDGKWRHLRWQTMLLQAGLIDDVEDALIWKRMRSRGTMDGSGHVPDTHVRKAWRGLEFGFELKGVSGFQFPKIRKDPLVKEEHERQVARYFLMSGFDLFVIVYEDKSTQQWLEWVVEPDEELIDEQREELEILNEHVDSKQLPDMLKQCRAQVGPIWNDCPYGGSASAACPKAGKWPRLRKATP